MRKLQMQGYAKYRFEVKIAGTKTPMRQPARLAIEVYQPDRDQATKAAREIIEALGLEQFMPEEETRVSSATYYEDSFFHRAEVQPKARDIAQK